MLPERSHPIGPELWKDTSKGGNIEKLHAVGQTENAEQLFLGSHNVGVFSLAEHTGIIAGTFAACSDSSQNRNA